MQNALHHELELKIYEEDYEYCSIIEIENDDPLIMNILSKAVMPDIKLS